MGPTNFYNSVLYCW